MPPNPPSHWTQHSGPNAWYDVWFPPTWRREISDGTVGFSAPDEGGVLTLSCFWFEESEDAALEKVFNLARLFPRRRNVQPLQSVDGGRQCISLQGEALLGADSPWWKRMFKRRKWRRWRVWCVHAGPVYVLGLYLQTGRVDREAETVAGMIVNSLTFGEEPASPPDVFARRVLELAREKFPLLHCEAAPDFQILLGDSKVNLLNFYRSYIHAPGQFESIVLPALTTVVQVQGWGKEQTEPGLDDVRGRIMPMLYPEDGWHERLPQMIGMPWVGGLVVLYVVDESHAYWFIRNDLLESWNITLDELHRMALRNLDRYFEDRPMDFTVAGEETGPRLLIPVRPDTYNTSRLLSGPFHETLRTVLGASFAVGAPSRDFFVAVSLDSAETVQQVRKKVADDFQQMDHPLSDRMLLVTHDGVAEYAPWSDEGGELKIANDY